MKKLILILLTLQVVISLNAQKVGFEYDLDGNMKLRKIIVVNSSDVKRDTELSEKVEEEIGELKIVIYPNPTNGKFQVSVSTVDTKLSNYYCIYSLNGSLLIKKEITSIMSDIDISTFATGSYLMDIYIGDKISRWKIIKK